MPFDRKVLMTGFTSSPVRTKSPVMAALPPPVGWKPIAVASPSGPTGAILYAVLADRVATRHAELIDPAIGLPLHADDLIELDGVEIDGGLRGWSRGGRERRLTPR